MNIKKMLPEKKKLMGRLFDFFDKKGFYIVLILCLAVVAVTTVTVITRNDQVDFGDDNIFTEPNFAMNESDGKLLADTTADTEPDGGKSETKQDQSSVVYEPVPSMKTADSSGASSGSGASGAPGQVSMPVKETQVAAAVATPKPAPFSPIRPVIGECIVEYAQDKLIFNKTLQEWTTHDGMDIASERGTTVKAAADGTIGSIKTDPRYGITIIIDHQNGFKTVYANLASGDMVQPNQKVKQGDVIGAVGTTAAFESGDQTHIHFEVLRNGILVNPADYLPKQ